MENKKTKATAISMAVIMAFSLFAFLPIVTAQGTVVSIEDVTVSATGESKVVPIMIEDVTDPDGVGAATITLEYDNNVVIVSDVADGEFDMTIGNIDNDAGITEISTMQFISAGLTGDVVVAYVNLTAVGSPDDTSVLNLTVTSLLDATPETNPIPHTVSDGTFTIIKEDTEPPVVTEPTATPSLISNDGTTFSTLSVNVTDASNISSVSIDLRPIGKSITTMSGPYPGSGTYYTTTNTSVGITPGTYNLQVGAIDELGYSNTSVSITLTVIERVPISIESVSAEPGGSVISQITVSNVTALSPIDSCTVYTVYDKSVVEVSDVAGGDFDSTTPTIANPYGVTLVSAEQTVSAGLMGDIVVAYVNFTAVGAMGSSSSLELDKTGPAPVAPPVLKNAEGEDIPYTVVNGVFTVEAEDTDPPIVTSPTAIPASIPDETDEMPGVGTEISISGEETSRLNVTVTDESGVSTVTIDLSPIGGSATQEMTNIPGTDVYTVETNASVALVSPPGTSGLHNITIDLQVNATDIYGYSNTSVTIPLTVIRNGDVNKNGVTDIGDAMYIAKWTVGLSGFEIEDEYLAVADVNDNGVPPDIGDAMYIAKWTVGLSGFEELH